MEMHFDMRGHLVRRLSNAVEILEKDRSDALAVLRTLDSEMDDLLFGLRYDDAMKELDAATLMSRSPTTGRAAVGLGRAAPPED